MLKSLLLMSAVAVAAPALAQSTAPANSTNAAQPAATATPAPETPAQPAATATPSTTAQQPTTAATPEAGATAAPAAAATPTAEPANSADAVAAVVSADWAKYDTDKDGYLSKTEFGVWMTALREQNPAQKAAVKDAEAWTNSAFAMADKDKSGTVNKDELAGFLKG